MLGLGKRGRGRGKHPMLGLGEEGWVRVGVPVEGGGVKSSHPHETLDATSGCYDARYVTNVKD